MKKILVVLAIIITMSSVAQQCGTRLSDSVYFLFKEQEQTVASQNIITINCYNTYLFKIVNTYSGNIIQPTLIKKEVISPRMKELGVVTRGLYVNEEGKKLDVAIFYDGDILIITEELVTIIYQ